MFLWKLLPASANTDDENMILGLAINKVHKDEQISLVCGETDTEVSSCCILMCLTADGKLVMFHFARYSSFFCLVCGILLRLTLVWVQTCQVGFGRFDLLTKSCPYICFYFYKLSIR